MSIYDKPSGDNNFSKKSMGALSAYNPNLNEEEVTRSIYDN